MRPPAAGTARAALALCLLLCALPRLGAQATANAGALEVSDEIKKENPLLRLEIVTLGSYPLALFYVGFIYDIQRYYENDRDSAYAPWPFRGSNSVALDNSERMARLEAALALSLTVGVIDGIIHASKVKKAKRLREARLEAAAEGALP
jgi:hypothetical protein